jgi:uncharacterized oxidoreductase
VLEAMGASDETAAAVAASLVLSNLKGVDSHGIVRVAEYVRAIERGAIDPAATPAVAERGSVLAVDGRLGFGQLAAKEAARRVAERSRERGAGVATVTRVHHVGRLGEYVESVAGAGCVALAFCNGGPPGGRVLPFGGSRQVLSTNPIAYAVPAGAHPPIVADFSTSAAAEGRLRVARQAGERVPAGWIVDAEGRPTTDPNAFYAGGALLPAGGHKGYALGLLVEILGGVLAGAGTASTGEIPGNGVLLLALDPSAFRERPSFLAGVDRVIEAVAAVPPAQGFDRVRLPGEPERETEARRRRGGIPVTEGTWAELAAAAASVGVEPIP